MARQALAPYFSGSAQTQRAAFSAEQERLRRAAENGTAGIEPARVFFSRGQSPVELGAIESEFRLDVIDVSLKAPLGDKGIVQSILNGMTNLLVEEGDLADRLASMIERHTACLNRRAEFLPPAERNTPLSPGDFKVYSARVAGEITALAALAEHVSVTVVLWNTADAKRSLLSDFEGARKRAPIDRQILLDPRFGGAC